MNTVDALKKLYKTLAGKDYAGDPNPTDAEMIDAIAKDATSGGSGSDSGPVIKFKANMTDGTATADPLAAGLSLTDLSDATVEMYVTDGVSEVLAGINKVCNFNMGVGGNSIQMTCVGNGADGLVPLILNYNTGTGEVTVLGDDSGEGGTT